MKIKITLLFVCFSLFTFGQTTANQKIIFFELGKSRLSDTNKKGIQSWLNSSTNYTLKKVVVSGYADTSGSEKVNLKYSKLRAESVSNYLNSIGVEQGKIEVHYYGESKSPYEATKPQTKERCVVIQLKLTKNTKLLVENNQKKKEGNATKKFENDTVFTFSKGTRIEVDAGTFYPVKIKDVSFELTEIFSLCDMLNNNTTTRATNGDCLTSAGMLYVKAVYDGEEIQPNKEKYVRIKIPVQSETLDEEMALYANYKNKNGEIVWDKIESKLSYDSGNSRYYLFETDTLFGFNLDKPIGVKCEKNGPLVKIPKSMNAYITQIYPGETYLAVAEKRTDRKFVLDELKYDADPYLIVIVRDEYGSAYIAEGKLNDLPYRRWSKKYVVKEKYFKKLITDYTGSNTVKERMCERLNAFN